MIRVKKASFNGIEFNVIATGITGGHKQSSHEFNNNKTSVQQHGAQHKVYSLSAIFIGSNALLQANQLITELDNAGTGVLMHPYLGELMVALKTHSTNIDTKRNQTTIELNFIQQDDVNLLSVDFHSLLLETIGLTKQATVLSTVTAINNSQNKQQTILDMSTAIGGSVVSTDLNRSLGHILDTEPVIIKSTNPITITFNQQHTAIAIANNKIKKQYRSTNDLTNDATYIINVFNQPNITNSPIANEFYNLLSVLARYLLETNPNLPRLKQHLANAKLPSDVLKQQFGDSVDEFNTNTHPLFNDESITYVG